MKTLKLFLPEIIVVVIFLGLAIASTPPRQTYRKPVPQPCIKHKPLTYSPILILVNLSGSYSMVDLAEAQRTRPLYILNALNALSPYKYQLANGVTPNLTLNITVTTDNYQHYGAEIRGYVYDGDFYTSLSTTYITFEKLYDDVASRVNWYITGGWCRNCPDPCNP